MIQSSKDCQQEEEFKDMGSVCATFRVQANTSILAVSVLCDAVKSQFQVFVSSPEHRNRDFSQDTNLVLVS